MIKRLCVLFTIAVAALALADHILVVGSHGMGGATAADGRVGAFQYEVAKRTVDAHSTLNGRLRFEQRLNDHGPRVLIEMGQPGVLGVHGNVCEFGGRASLTTMHQGHNVTVHGRASVRVVDRRDRQHPKGDPDGFRIHFEGMHDVRFAFEGLVNHGDLVVFTRRTH